VVKQHCQDIYYLKVNHPHPTPLSHRLQSTVHKLSYFCQLMQTKQKKHTKTILTSMNMTSVGFPDSNPIGQVT